MNRRRNEKSHVTNWYRLRLVESLESRACCSADDALMSISLESAESIESVSSVESSFDPKNFAVEMEATEAGMEQPVVQEESSEVITDAAAIDEAQQVDLAGEVIVTVIEECLSNELETASETPGETTGETVDFGNVGEECAFDSNPSVPGKSHTNKPTEVPHDNSSGNGDSRGELAINVSLAAPVVSSSSTTSNDLRPQLQPIEQLSVGRLQVAIPDSSPASPLRNVETTGLIVAGKAYRPDNQLAEVDLEAKPLASLSTELSSTEAVIAMLNGDDPKDVGKRVRRLSNRSQIAPIPRVLLEEIDFTLRSTDRNSELGQEVETDGVRVSELPTVEAAVKAFKIIRLEPGDKPGNELGTITPPEPTKPLSQRGSLTLPALIAGLILLPLRTRDWQAGIRQFTAFGWKKTTKRKCQTNLSKKLNH
ncbi:MAG: hypothetical protein SFV81_13580 [Pirellulaceae bacterium]|nr:hypothetical protein [Pirellulaceae bacterium]